MSKPDYLPIRRLRSSQQAHSSSPAPPVYEASTGAETPDAGRQPTLEQSLAIPVNAPSPSPSGERRSLPDSLREKMERAFQHDFSGVRLRLSNAASHLGARALTRGEEIILSPRHYQPASLSGQALLGHELAHVVQQRTGHVRGSGLAGSIYDRAPLEAEADRQGAQAARGAQVSGVSHRSLQKPASSDASVASLPFQPAWEWIEIGNEVKKKQLKNNHNDTYTDSASGQVYKDTGKTHSTDGSRVLTPCASPTPSGSTLYDPKNVLFAIGETGKFEYLANTPLNRLAHQGTYLEMDPKHFSLFKNSGKRTASSKVMDPNGGKRYAYYEPSKQFYTWDSSALGGRGTALSTTENTALLDRFNRAELVDRRREDRTNQPLQPFDVGPYKKTVKMPTASHPNVFRTYAPLSGVAAWAKEGLNVNRDHVPSGESLNQRGDSDAYSQGFTIAIPNPETHQPFSPTFGTDNSVTKGMMDDVEGTPQRRVLFDAQHPAAAAFRDITFMLDQTENQDYSQEHAYLDLTQQENRLRQLGGYRALFRRNTQLNGHMGDARGFNPEDDAYDYTVGSRLQKNSKKISKRSGAYKYRKVANTKQGRLLEMGIRKHLLATRHAHLL
ncbi:DUF4157 domain-containing protein [Corallococcus sp. AB004]|nr:DUF4157 domain-containing protein [Corallococcus sp. AB004]